MDLNRESEKAPGRTMEASADRASKKGHKISNVRVLRDPGGQISQRGTHLESSFSFNLLKKGAAVHKQKKKAIAVPKNHRGRKILVLTSYKNCQKTCTTRRRGRHLHQIPLGKRERQVNLRGKLQLIY